MASSSDLIEEALQHASEGRVARAEEIARSLLQLDRDNAEAYYVLGIVEYGRGRMLDARNYLQRAIELDDSAYWYHLASAEVLRAMNDSDRAIAEYGKTLELAPETPEASSARASLLTRAGRLPEAAEEYRRWTRLDPNSADALQGLSYALHHIGDHQGAIAAAERSLKLDPDNANVLSIFARSLAASARGQDALAAAQRATDLAPDQASTHMALAKALEAARDRDAAEDEYERALKLDENIPDAYTSLGVIQSRYGDLDRAFNSWRRAIELAPKWPLPGALLLMNLNYDGRLSAREVFDEHVRWARRHVEPVTASAIHTDFANDRDPNRQLRVGLVSPDFKNHPVGMFIYPFIKSHDRTALQITCFSDVEKSVPYTEAIKSVSDQWVESRAMTDVQLADAVRQRKIDILIDLTGHTDQNRLATFARRPAPVQITYVGYCNTTGMSSIDWIVGDEITDPSGATQPYTEKPLRLSSGFSCWQPLLQGPDIGDLPAKRNGFVTFAAFHRPKKIGDSELELFARVLRAVPHSKILFWRDLLSGRVRERLVHRLGQHELAPDRYEIRNDQPPGDTHLNMYSFADVSLDTQPWSGHTTACESMWMGVPFITMLGNTHAGRMAA